MRNAFPQSPRPRILIFGVKYFPSRGGTSRVVEAILTELQEQFDFTIYCYKHPKAQNHLPHVKVVEIPETPIKGIGVFWYYLRCFWHLWRNGKGKYDLVHIHKIDAAFFTPLISRKFPVITTAHALPYLDDKWSAIGKRYFHFAEKRYMFPGGTPTVISKDHQRHFEAAYQREVTFIPNGVDLDTPIDHNAAQSILNQHKVQGGYHFFAARRIIPLKGLHTYLAALKKMDYKGSVVIAGDMDQLKDYSKKIIALASGLNVHFIGFIEDKPTLLGLVQKAELFVFPSELEGMSIMLLEAANTDTPILASEIPANTNIFSDEEVSFFTSQSEDDLIAKLEEMMQQPDLVKIKALRAKGKIQSTYSREAMAAQYAELYRSILNAAPKTSR